MKTEFFLGANSANGFYSLYDEYCREQGSYLYLIKGGPGGGKSSFMARIAEEAEKRGYDVELIHCSGDPDSLDAVYITELGVGWFDATSPHIVEPDAFAVCSCYVNLGQFCSRTENEDIVIYTQLYKEMYDTAYSYLKAANCVKSTEIHGLCSKSAINKAKSRGQSAAIRELGKKRSGENRVQRRFIRCISCSGEVVLSDTVSELCKHIHLLDDRFGLEQYYLEEVLKNAGGESIIVCPSPLNPQRLDALLFPKKGLAFVASSLMPDINAYRHIRLDALVSPDALREKRSEIRRKAQLYSQLTDTAISYLKRAKEYHDKLENAYHSCIDFRSLTEFTESELKRIFENK
ncbi:MAG: hypothetical protein Q4A83_05615 [Bacillota bacterium]|nr:hypothetical protein [Bacillota bacterium]